MILFLIFSVITFLTIFGPDFFKHYMENKPTKYLKTKLLKESRKRFQIIYNKEGHYIWDTQFLDNYLFIDNYNSFNSDIFESKEDCLKHILKILRNEHPDMGKRKRIRNRNKKIWYGN